MWKSDETGARALSLFSGLDLQLPDAELDFRPHWLAAPEADRWFACLRDDTPWQQPRVHIHGRLHPVPRLVAWYGDVAYRYSGLTHPARGWTPLLEAIRERVVEAVGEPLNGVLLNFYRDGQDSMGWHSDDEAALGRDPLVVSLNLGGTRRFDLRRKGTSRIGHSLALGHGSLLVMGGPTQHHWQHQVAKTRSPCAPRINLTFRSIRFPS